MTVADQVREIVLPLLPEHELELYDIFVQGSLVRVIVDRHGGVDLDALASVTRSVSRALDEADPIVHHYTLEVTSPGVERPLRTPEQFQRAVGEVVSVKTLADVEGNRRTQGVLEAADERGITVRPEAEAGSAGGSKDADTDAVEGGGNAEAAGTAARTLAYDQIDRARTVFEWGTPGPKPGHPRGGRTTSPGSKKKRERRS